MNVDVSGQVQGGHHVGGVVGVNRTAGWGTSPTGVWGAGGWGTSPTGVISKASSSVTVTGSGATGGVGGLVGWHRIGTAGFTLIEDSMATGDVSGANQVGGLIGLLEQNSIIRNCLATGPVSVTAGGEASPLIGAYLNGNSLYSETVVTSTYWMKEAACINCSPTGTGAGFGEVKSSSELLRRNTFQGWDFSNTTWIMKDGFTWPEIFH